VTRVGTIRRPAVTQISRLFHDSYVKMFIFLIQIKRPRFMYIHN